MEKIDLVSMELQYSQLSQNPVKKNEPSELIGDEKSLPPTKVGSMLVKKSNTRSVSPTLIKLWIE
jgi:hypothetical protein